MAVGVGEMMFSRIHDDLSQTHKHTQTGFLPNLVKQEGKRGREWERGSKPVSGMDSLKWIVLGDIALTFVQSTVLRDLPVYFNGFELAKGLSSHRKNLG